MPKPKTPRAPRKKLDPDETYLMANLLIPDSGPLASFNAVYELHNGTLSTIDEAGDRAARRKDVRLAAVIAYVALPEDQFSMRKRFPGPLEAQEAYARCADALRAIPSGTALEEAAGSTEISYPTTIGAMALWQKPDGTAWTVFYHHPNVGPRHAVAILKEVIDDFAKDDEEDSAMSSKN